MSISKSYNKQNGVTYVYEVLENHWDKEKKRPQSKRKLIGKIDPDTGEIVPTSRKKKSINDDVSPDYRSKYVDATQKIAQQEEYISELKNDILIFVSEERACLSEMEQKISERRTALEKLVRKVEKYG